MTTKTLRSARCGSVVRSYLFDRVTVIQLPACFGLSPPHPTLLSAKLKISYPLLSSHMLLVARVISAHHVSANAPSERTFLARATGIIVSS